jgi:serine protease Do
LAALTIRLPHRRDGARAALPLAPALALALVLGFCDPVAAETATEAPAPAAGAPLKVDPGPRFVPESFAELADRLSPAVVNITTTTTIADVDESMRPVIPPGSPFEDFFRDFMDRQPGAPKHQQRSSALGSGFIVSPDGYIVTNNHVIDSADEISVELFHGGNLDAHVVGRDTRTDIALLKVDSDEPLPFVQFGDSDAAHVGDWVLAIGNPLGQGFSVSAGIVSARNRTLQGSYDDFIQTDAAINRGNSGGPLFDMTGGVIGVNTAILSPNGGSIGIGFAMSSAVVSRVVDQLRQFGETRRGWLGVRIQNVDADVADAIGLKEAKGALVTDVPEGPALTAGIKSGDVILKFGGKDVPDTRELVRIVADTAVGKSVDVVVFRDGAETTLKVEIGLLEDATTLAAAPGATPNDTPPPSEQSVLGMTVAVLTDALRDQFGLDKDVDGLIVTGLDDGSDAYAKGMREGDVIAEVGQEAVASPKEMQTRIDAAEAAGRNSILLLVKRDGQPRFVALNLSS